MPTVSVRLLRLSLIALLAGAAIGAWLLAVEPWDSGWLPRLQAAHIHLMLFGWLMPFVIGTAYWILPRHARADERGSVPIATGATWLIGAGVVLGPAGALAAIPGLERAGLACTLLGGALFVRLLWPRVKAFGVGREVEVRSEK